MALHLALVSLQVGDASASHQMLRAPSTISHKFVFRANKRYRSVSVAGTFNRWNKDRDPMTLQSDGVTWSKTATLPFGRVQYKFVLDGESWIQDPSAKDSQDDGGGNVNSALMVTPVDFTKAARVGDGVIAKSALFHETKLPWLNFDRGLLLISFRARPNDVESIKVRILGKSIPLNFKSTDGVFATYQARVAWNGKQPINYDFEIKDGSQWVYFGESGVLPQPGRKFVISPQTFAKFVTPSWVPGAVLYQIFPDRFANGNVGNDPKDVQPWSGTPTWFNRFGGDIAGVRQHANYLADLGATCIYFNPVFKSPSNHRYDASSYVQIDPEFGTNVEFARLGALLKAKGIRTVMDLALNHTAVDYPAFLDVLKNGAASKFKNWYFIKSYPVVVQANPPYDAWYGFSSMPKLNVMNPETTQRLLDVADYWKNLMPGLSGYRLDAANEVDMRFWRLFRNHVKAMDPEQWIVGEEWGDARPWLQGDQWDSSMNYEFRSTCLDFIAKRKGSPSAFMNRLMANYSMYPPQSARVMMNMLTSHDTARFLTECDGDVKRDAVAATIQFSWVGAPSIYYGEEIGMLGGKDPANRAPMAWNRVTQSNWLLNRYKKLTRIRTASKALQWGEPIPLSTDDQANTLSFARVDAKDLAITVVNVSDQPKTISIPLTHIPPATLEGRREFTDGISGRHLRVTGSRLSVTLQGMEAAILLPTNATVFHSAKAPSRVGLAPSMHLSSLTASRGIKELSL